MISLNTQSFLFFNFSPCFFLDNLFYPKGSTSFHGNAQIRSHLYIWAVVTVSRTKNINHSPMRKELSDR
jgi:hypothetical protein